MAYVSGNELRIFPASNRSVSDQQNNNWLTEFNISSLVNQFIAGTDKNGFVITQGKPLSETLSAGAAADNELPLTNQSLEFNIAGYYFQVISVGNLVNLLDGNSPYTEPLALTSYLTFSKREVTSENPSLDYSEKDVVYSATAYVSKDLPYRVLLGEDAKLNADNETYAAPYDPSKENDPIGLSLDLFYKRNNVYYIPSSSRINFSGIQTFKHKATKTEFTVRGAEITNYTIDDGEIK